MNEPKTDEPTMNPLSIIASVLAGVLMFFAMLADFAMTLGFMIPAVISVFALFSLG